MIISPVGAGKRHSNKNIYRLFIVGQKQLQALGIFMIVWRR
jgi:hypothetical protein